jgi:putative transposase
MARQPRFFAPGVPLHVIQRGNNRGPIFASSRDYRFFLDCLIEASRAHEVSIHAYVLMTNHIHLLATPVDRGGLPRVMQSVGRRYVQHFNRVYGRTGTLWEGRYRAAAIDSDQYFLTCMRYIELNPVRAGMVHHAAQYRWSSYGAHARGATNKLVTDHYLYDGLGSRAEERREAYRQLCEVPLAYADLESIRRATNSSWALGDASFVRWIEWKCGRQSAPRRSSGTPAHRGAQEGESRAPHLGV